MSDKIDFDAFRLRRFVDALVALDEVEIHDESVTLSDISGIIEATPKAVLFHRAGPEAMELVAAVSGGRRRLAAAFGVAENEAHDVYRRRLAEPQRTVEVTADEAPVREVELTGDAVDLTKLPFHVQHELDGAPYISSGIDYTADPETGRTNVGCRRLMLRGRNRLGFNLTAPSDLREIYKRCVARGHRLAASFTIGAHPLDMMAAATRAAGNELEGVATLRGVVLPVVKCLTNDIRVPADAEMVIEGYIDPAGYTDQEGPFGEYMGYYGPMHDDPVFHVTAITHRHDVLHQSVLHGMGHKLAGCESTVMGALRNETQAMDLLRSAGIQPTAIHCKSAAAVGHHMRVAIRQTAPGQARAAIAVLLGNMQVVKHVFVVDEDIDVCSDDQMEWAFSTRFQADRDLTTMSGMREMFMDPSTEKRGIGTKAGFDLTFPFPRPEAVTSRAAVAPRIGGAARFQSVRQALESGPMHFATLMAAVGSRDGRELVLDIEELRSEGILYRLPDGEYALRSPARTD